MLDLDEETLATLGYGDSGTLKPPPQYRFTPTFFEAHGINLKPNSSWDASRKADPAYKEAHNRASKRYRATHREQEAKRLRDRYWSDAAFREKRKEQARLCNRKRRLLASTLKHTSSPPAT